jgi:hypothetical protein
MDLEQTLILSLYYLDDTSLLRACQTNKKLYNRVCPNIWLKRIIDNFGLNVEDINKYKGNQSYAKYYFYLKDILYSTTPSLPDNSDFYIDKRWSNIQRVLCKNINYDNYDIIKAAIYLGANVNMCMEEIHNVSYDTFKLLVDSGLDISTLVYSVITDKQFIQYFIDAGGDINSIDEDMMDYLLYKNKYDSSLDHNKYLLLSNLIDMGYKVKLSDREMAEDLLHNGELIHKMEDLLLK